MAQTHHQASAGAGLAVRPPESTRWDLLSLGEVMLRFDPGEGRIVGARSFRVWEGGGEYNVARGLRRCFGLRTSIATAWALDCGIAHGALTMTTPGDASMVTLPEVEGVMAGGSAGTSR